MVPAGRVLGVGVLPSVWADGAEVCGVVVCGEASGVYVEGAD